MGIHILPPDVAAKIAAGEVVERPANVAKELLENSINAGSTEIRVEIREGGRRLLRVSDNGHGIAAAETPLAFERHATSKLATVDDLTHIATFGFRGEALYSIAAVSQLTLASRHQDEEFGTSIQIHGGRIQDQGRVGAPIGTVVTVENLFFNVPARQKFLRSATTEAGQIASVVQRFAMAHADRRFSFVNEGRLIFQSTGSGQLLDVLVKVLGLENARQMISFGPVDGPGDKDEDGLHAEVDFMGSGDQPEGHVIPARAPWLADMPVCPRCTRANRSNIDLFVNRRYVEDRALTHAVVQAYHTLLPVGRFPIAVVLVDMDPADVDVNVHPQKTQVRFVEDRRIFGAVQKAVRRAVVAAAPIPDVGVLEDGRLTSAPRSTEPAVDSGWSARRESILGAGQQQPLDMIVPHPGSGRVFPDGGSMIGKPSEGIDAVQPPLADRASRLPPLRVVGQVGAMYIIAEGPEGVFLIDQHAAHERILYEQFMAQRYGTADGEVARQQLLDPLTLHAGSQLAGLVANHLEELGHVGFQVEPFGGDTFLVRAVPGVLAGEDPMRALEEIVSSFGERAQPRGRNVGKSAGQDGLQTGCYQSRTIVERS